MSPWITAPVLAGLMLIGCGDKRVHVPDNSHNGPINAVGAIESAGFKVRAIVDGRDVPSSEVLDQLPDGRFCRVRGQDPKATLAKEHSTVTLVVRCGPAEQQ